MNQPTRAVALRSADSALIEEVRAVVAVADIPLMIHPPGAPPPAAALLLDGRAEHRADDEQWVAPTRRAAWVGHSPDPDARQDHLLVLPDDAEQLLTLARSASQQRNARVVGVVGARGGAGASSFASALARAGAQAALAVALVDLDHAGPGLDLMLGLEHEGGLRWPDLDGSGGTLPGEALSDALPVWHGVHVLSADWRGGARRGIAPAAVDALAAGHDLVTLDLPRGDSAWANHCDTVLIVATGDIICAEAARATAGAWAGVQQHLVVRGTVSGGVTAAEVAEATGVPLAATMRSERGLAAGVQRGVAPGDNRRGALLRGARRVVQDLGLAS